jgi:oligopeptide transport system permease protein
MLKYIFKRILSSLPLIFVVLSLSFFLVRAAPGSPLDKDAELPPEVKESLAKQYGLDQPLHIQYFRFLGNAVRGDFGRSYIYKDREVSEIIRDAFPVSATLGALSMTLALIVGILFGVISALRQNSWVDHFIMTTVLFGKSIPPMVLAPVFIAAFAIALPWVPVAGWEQGGFKDMIGPVLCLGLYDVAAISRLTRGSMLEVIRQKYIVTLRAKGTSEFRITFMHALREAIMPLVTYLGPTLSSLLVGTVVIEQVFNIPGLGRYLVSSALNRDYTLFLGIVTLASALLVTFNMFSDILLGLLDPRIRLK